MSQIRNILSSIAISTFCMGAISQTSESPIDSTIQTGTPTAVPTSKEKETAIPDVPPDLAMVVIIRKRAEPMAWNTSIYIDNKKVVSLTNQSYSWTTVKEGPHTLKAKWPFLSGQKNCEISFVASAGVRTFVEILGVSQYEGINPGLGHVWLIGSGARVIDASYADSLIATPCKLISPVQ